MNQTTQETYAQFTISLLTLDGSLMWPANYTAGMPLIHRCRRTKACPGQKGNASNFICQEGSHGPLCELCSEGFFSTSEGCSKCPSKWRGALQLVGITALVLALFIFLSWKQANARDLHSATQTNVGPSSENVETEKTDTWLDQCVAFLRICIGFIQVTTGIMTALVFVPWPSIMVSIGNHLRIIEFNIIEVMNLACFNHHLRFNHLWKTVIYSLFVTATIILVAVLYRVWVWYAICRHKLNPQRRVLALKFCLTGVVWILYACYPSLSQYIIATVPHRDFSCIYFNCSSPDEITCQWYLKADVSVRCDSFSGTLWYICQFLLLIPIGLPLLLLVLLYIKQRDTNAHRERGSFVKSVYDSVSFLHKGYEKRFWFWEVVEMERKLVLTSGLQFFGKGSATELAVASILANAFVVMHAQLRPTRKSLKWQHALQLTSLLVVALNIMLGVLRMITADGGLQSYLADENAAYNPQTDETVFTVLFYIANGAFFFILTGKTLYSGWKATKHWCCRGLSCCECVNPWTKCRTNSSEELEQSTSLLASQEKD